MLSLNLKSGEYLTIGDNITMQVFHQTSSQIRVAIQAPREVPILRGEVHERTGERPAGLREKRTLSPTEQRHNVKRLEKLAEKQEQRQRQAEEKTATVLELLDLTDRMEDIVAAHGGEGDQETLTALRNKLLEWTKQDA